MADMAAGLESRKVSERETPVSNFIPYSHHVTENIISTKTAEYVSVWKIDGRSHQSASDEQLFQWIRELNNALKGVASENLSIWSHIVRRRVHEYPDSEFKNPFARALDERYRRSFANYSLMVNDLYLTIVYRPMTDKILSFFAAREKESLARRVSRQEACVKALDDVNRSLGKTLKPYGGELLSIYEKNGHAYSAPLEFFGLLVNGEHIPMPVCRDRFADYMAHNRPLFSKWGEVGEIRTSKGLRRFGMLEVREYDESTEPGHLNTLMESNFEFVLTQSFSCLSRHAGKDYLQRHQRNLEDARDVAVSQIKQISTALDDLVSGRFIMGEHHFSLTVFGDTVDDVRDYLAKSKSDLSDVGIVAKSVDLALEAGFWAQLPANWKYRPRPAPITSQNFLCFSPLHNFLSGKPTGNPWGPAITILKTVSGTPLYFNFHSTKDDEDAEGKRRLGNSMFIGKSGVGKTVTMGFTLAQAQKLGPTTCLFDKDQGLQALVLALGGRYLPLKNGEPSGFNPMQLEPTPQNILFLKRFVKALAESTGEPFTHADEEDLNAGMDVLFNHIDKPLRSLSMLVQSMPNYDTEEVDARPRLHARLLKWCEGGDYGWLFDNAEDKLDLTTHTLYGFDVTDFLENPEIRSVLMMYLIYRTENMIDGRRFIYMFDEFQKPLEDEYFQDLAQNKNRVIRKQNGIFVYATQEPEAIIENPIGRTLVQQCATYIFLPNPGADYDAYVNGFKLTQTEYEIVKNLGEYSRRFLVKQGDNSAVAELNLEGFDDELLIMSGDAEKGDIAGAVVAEFGDDPTVWIPHYLNRVRGLEN